jgi:hypothetical protein
MTRHTEPPAPPRSGRPWIEVTLGVAAITATAALGAYVHIRAGVNAVDRLGFALPRVTTHSWRFFRAVTWLGTVPALAIGSVSAALVARFTGRRDRWRALACLIGPPVAAVVNQLVIKPLVGRQYLGDLSFASGSVTVIAAVSTAWVLAVPRRFRPATAVLGSLATALMMVAVIAVRWHYPTDAVAGAVFGVGMVLIVDGAIRFISRSQPGDAPGASQGDGGSSRRAGRFAPVGATTGGGNHDEVAHPFG